ncbi:uncharacterized protein UTRI_04920_B [Ustilago trichophora]|uniref:GATA-type domain-containing protein n=1 Tax=Ustilago trichophora TaxID=86804 RepID=A0A5C3EIL4_9BASI|nr:uncharacterized protein UTRI_04920_B [Ustilago trichophora]
MEHHTRQTKVTLPPLSSLTTSIDLDRRHETLSTHGRNPIDPSPVPSSRDVAIQDTDIQAVNVGSSAASMSRDRHWSIDRANVTTSRPTSAAYSPTNHKVANLTSMSGSPTLRNSAPTTSTSPRALKPSMRGVIESNRPRSYSSPHRNRMHNPTRRSSLADVTEVDRLLEGLIYVQDINRRLGLNTGGPASPSIFHNAGAAETLRNKLQDELHTMALFSQSRAESVAKQLGLPAYFAPSRRTPGESSPQQSNLLASVTASGQAGHPSWAPNDPAERTQSSMGRLTLEERHHRDVDYVHYSEASETEYDDARSGHHVSGPGAYASHPVHTDLSLRTISRAISFEQPRSVQYRHQLPHASLDSHRFEMDARMQHDHAMRHPLTGSGVTHMYHPDGRHQQQMELLDRRRLAGKGMKRVRKRKNEHHQECLGCQAKETPEWRKGPMGPRTLCNACGLLYAKLTKRKQQEAEAAAKASGKSAEEIVREREESPGAKQASLEALRAELNLANGMRNRATSSSTPGSNVSMLHGPHLSAAHMHAARFYDGPHDIAPPSQPWPARENFQPPFAHQMPHHRPTMSNTSGSDRMDSRAMDNTMRPYSGGSIPAAPMQRYADETHLRSASGRANSLGHVESFEQLVGRPTSSAAGPTRYLRPYSQEHSQGNSQGSSGSYPSPPQIGRQRSSSTLHASAAPYYDRPVSPSAQRRHHPYM